MENERDGGGKSSPVHTEGFHCFFCTKLLPHEPPIVEWRVPSDNPVGSGSYLLMTSWISVYQCNHFWIGQGSNYIRLVNHPCAAVRRVADMRSLVAVIILSLTR